MKKLNKKGFTIVELVIVIAVIAILAAVLIPTFSNVITKSHESAALQGARNAYTAIMAETDADFSKVGKVAIVEEKHVVQAEQDSEDPENPTYVTLVDLDDYIKDITSATFADHTITVVANGVTVSITAEGASLPPATVAP